MLERNRFHSRSGLDTQNDEAFQDPFGVRVHQFYRYDRHTEQAYRLVVNQLNSRRVDSLSLATLTRELRKQNFTVTSVDSEQGRGLLIRAR